MLSFKSYVFRLYLKNWCLELYIFICDFIQMKVILAEDNEIRDKLAEHDLHVQTISEVAPIEVNHIFNCIIFMGKLIMMFWL